MKKYFLLLLFLFSSCAENTKTFPKNAIIEQPSKPILSKIQWNQIDVNNEMLYTLDQKNMDILNNNLIEILNYERKQKLIIQYYQNILK